MATPSAGKLQTWEFIVVREKGPLEEIIRVHQYSQMLKQASVTIVVCADPRRCEYPFRYWIQDCAEATENILAEAGSIELETYWLGIYPHHERITALRRIFSVPEQIIPFSVVAIGYPIKKIQSPDQYDAIRIHKEKW